MRKELQKGCLGVRGGGERKQQLRRGPKNAVAHHLYPYEPVLWLLPGAQLLFALRVVLPTGSFDLPITLPLAPTITSLSLRMNSQMTPSHPLKSLGTISPFHTQDLGRNPGPPSKEDCGPTERL